ncbi:hypothetical protein ACFSKN_02550 [Mariniflexile gromovii]|uniref:Acetyltransferase (GNAT) family protein n=1 Tax=Mariniflexile gromovii TaxID=362523 RepID=A0ABS4BPG2_9FLAO|nr:hypothetical protein [Mariniflexile gromovii]MBP0902484.1 hypothetical protein [Mariniflexile gromovii]
MIKVIENKNEWNNYLLKMDSYDFYHTYEYHNALKSENDSPILITYNEEDVEIAIPFLKRKINNSEHFDLTSVHGYVGPVSLKVDNKFNTSRFSNKLLEFLKKEQIVSVFSKMNPYIKTQEKILSGLFDIQTIGELIFFDQEMDNENQILSYKRNTKQRIAQLKNKCTIQEVIIEKDLQHFIDLYHDSMKRLNADKKFFFDENYFKTLSESKLFNTKLLIAINNSNKDIMAGVFCTNTKEIAHIELAFTNELYFKPSPVRILFDKCRELYKNNTIKYLNLGGGSGGRTGSLMSFKASFTQNYVDWKVCKLIVLPEIYNSLITNEQKKDDSGYFPKYRLELSN